MGTRQLVLERAMSMKAARSRPCLQLSQNCSSSTVSLWESEHCVHRPQHQGPGIPVGLAEELRNAGFPERAAWPGSSPRVFQKAVECPKVRGLPLCGWCLTLAIVCQGKEDRLHKYKSSNCMPLLSFSSLLLGVIVTTLFRGRCMSVYGVCVSNFLCE